MASRRNRESVPFSLFAFQDIITSVTGIVLFITLILTLELLTKEVASPVQQTALLIPEINQALSEVQAEIALLKERLREQSTANESTARISSQEIERNQLETNVQVVRLKAEIEKLKQQAKRMSAEQETWETKRLDRNSDRMRLNSLRETIDQLNKEKENLTQTNRVIFNPSDAAGIAWIIDLSESAILVAQAGVSSVPVTFDSPIKELRIQALMHWVRNHNPNEEYFVLLARPGTIEMFYELRDKLQSLRFPVGFDLLPNDQMAIDPQFGAGTRPILP